MPCLLTGCMEPWTSSMRVRHPLFPPANRVPTKRWRNACSDADTSRTSRPRRRNARSASSPVSIACAEDGLCPLTLSPRMTATLDAPTASRAIGSRRGKNGSRGIRTNLRVLVDRERLGRMHELIDDFKARGLAGDDYLVDYHFSPVSLPHSPEREVSSKQIVDALVEQGLSFDDARAHVIACRKAWDNTLLSMEKRGLPYIHPSRCSAIEGRMGVDPYGRVYRCLRAFGHLGRAALTDSAGRQGALHGARGNQGAGGLCHRAWVVRTCGYAKPQLGDCPLFRVIIRYT